MIPKKQNPTQHILGGGEPSMTWMSTYFKNQCIILFKEPLLKEFFEDAMKWKINKTAQECWSATHWGIQNSET